MNDKVEQHAIVLSVLFALLVGLLSVGVALADMFGFLENWPWLYDRIPTIILLLLGTVASYLILERRQNLKRIEESHDKITRILSENASARIRTFETGDEAIDYLCRRVSECQKYVDQASLDRRRESNLIKHNNFSRVKDHVIVTNRVKYRYLYNVNSRRNGSVQKWLEMSKGNFAASGIAVSGESFGVLTFIIFDEKEVYVRSPYKDGIRTNYWSIEEPSVVKLFLDWFNFLWNDAIYLDPNNSAEDIESTLNELLQKTFHQTN